MLKSSPAGRRPVAVLFACAAVLAATPVPVRADEPPALRFAAFSSVDVQGLAVNGSPDVAAARAGVDAAAAAVAQARGVNGLSLIIGYQELPQSGGLPGVTWSQRLGTYELQATLGDVSALSPLVAQAAAALRQAIADEQTAERTERLKVVGLYFTALQTRAVLLAKRDAIDGAEDFEADVRSRFDAHKVPYLDLLRAEVSLAKAREDEANAQAVDANAADALAREIARPLGDLRDTLTQVQTQTTPEVIDDDRAIAIAFAQRPELRSADRNVEAAQHGLAAAQRAVIPPVTVAAGYVNGVDSGTVIGAPAVGISMQIPLSGIAGARISAATAAVRAAEAKRDGTKRALALEVGAAARTAAAAIIARMQSAASLDTAESYRAYAATAYRLSSTGAIMVKDAQDIYDQAVIDDITAEYAMLQAQAVLDIELAP